MNPDPERWNDAHAPVYYPATAVSAMHLTPGDPIHLGTHTVDHHEVTPCVAAAVIDAVDLDTWMPLVAVDWHAQADPGVFGRTMFERTTGVRRAGIGCRCNCGNSGTQSKGGTGCAGASAGNGGTHCGRPGQCAS